MKHITGRPCQ